MEELKESDLSIIYTTHYMEEVERLCQNVGVMDKGKFLFLGSLEDLKKQEGESRLESSYLSLTSKKHPSEESR